VNSNNLFNNINEKPSIHDIDTSISHSYVKIENIEEVPKIKNQPLIEEKIIEQSPTKKIENIPLEELIDTNTLIEPQIEIQSTTIIPPKVEETILTEPTTNINQEIQNSEQDEIQKSILLQNLNSHKIPETNIEDQPDDILEKPSDRFQKYLNPVNIGYAAVSVAGLIISYLLYKKYSK
jgi:hypothetical protein